MNERHLPLFVLAILIGCGGTPPKPDQAPTTVEMEPMVVELSVDKDGSTSMNTFDAQQLFEAGEAAFNAKQFAECDQKYSLLLERFPKSRYVHASLYNRGLCLEEMGQHALAGRHFEQHAILATTLADRRDGEFRWGYNLVKTGDFARALGLYKTLLDQQDLTPLDRAECLLRQGISHAGLNRLGLAERSLEASIEQVELGTEGLTQGNDTLAEVHFVRGEIYQRLSHDVPLKLPIEKMKGDLADKTRFFRRSQKSYLKALNVQHPYWATAAGLKLGELYEAFYRDVLNAQVPDDFDEKTTLFYVAELRKKLQPLLEHSLSIYERNMSMSQRIGADNEWVKETESRLERLRLLIEETEKLDPEKALEAAAESETKMTKPPPSRGVAKPAPPAASKETP